MHPWNIWFWTIIFRNTNSQLSSYERNPHDIMLCELMGMKRVLKKNPSCEQYLVILESHRFFVFFLSCGHTLQSSSWFVFSPHRVMVPSKVIVCPKWFDTKTIRKPSIPRVGSSPSICGWSHPNILLKRWLVKQNR